MSDRNNLQNYTSFENHLYQDHKMQLQRRQNLSHDKKRLMETYLIDKLEI